MVIRNQKILNAGNYKRIHIADNINVYGEKNNFDTILTTEFVQSLKGLSNIEKKQEVIRYFLRNNKICTITKEYATTEYIANTQWVTKERLVIKSLSGKILRIEKNDEALTEELLKEIDIKYEMDRIDYFNNNDFEVYSLESSSLIATSKKYYSFYFDEDLKSIVGQAFVNKKGLSLDIEINNNEISSIDRYILESIINSGELVSYYASGGSDVYVFKDENNNYKSVKVGYTLDRKIFYPMIRERKENKKDEKKLMLRMEEFK